MHKNYYTNRRIKQKELRAAVQKYVRQKIDDHYLNMIIGSDNQKQYYGMLIDVVKQDPAFYKTYLEQENQHA